ncbi:coat protein [Mulberry crinivirus]|nr:coat protein [Mulberry crinivirus]WBP49980.1 coat protein [Mulberry crinivirus]
MDQTSKGNDADASKKAESTAPPVVDPVINDTTNNGAGANAPVGGRFSTRELFPGISSRDEIVNSDQLEPDKLKDIEVSATRGDCLSANQLKLFEDGMKKFCKTIVKAEPNEAQFAAFVLSFVQASLNQSTSMKNQRLRHLENSFSVGGSKFTWRTSDFISFTKALFPDVPNAIRRYTRTIEDQIETMKSTGKVESDGHLAAKHGTVSQFWNSTSDFTNGCRTNISDDDLAANYLQKQAATKGRKKERQIFNVSQLTGASD